MWQGIQSIKGTQDQDLQLSNPFKGGPDNMTLLLVGRVPGTSSQRRDGSPPFSLFKIGEKESGRAASGATSPGTLAGNAASVTIELVDQQQKRSGHLRRHLHLATGIT